jgi:quercetin dioxygenase-like cupin family protein
MCLRGLGVDGKFIVELILDSGEAKVLKTGDVLIHRGTMHSWRNTSDTEIARMVIVVLPSEDITIGGKGVEGKLVG